MRKKDKTKKFYQVPVQWTVVGTMGIEADSPEEAAEIAYSGNTPLPDDYSYVDDSFIVFEDEIEEID